MIDPMDAIPLHRRSTDLRKILGSSIEALEAQASAREVDLRFDAEDAVGRIDVDAEKIAWAVTTLVGNALRYVRAGTRLHPGGSIIVRLRKQDDAIVIDVQDDGPGIPRDKLLHLFERSPDDAHTSSLALLLIHDVVAAHGGTVSAKSSTSAADHGTTITLRIPAR
jgi:signal transduction histidine kinase